MIQIYTYIWEKYTNEITFSKNNNAKHLINGFFLLFASELL